MSTTDSASVPTQTSPSSSSGTTTSSNTLYLYTFLTTLLLLLAVSCGIIFRSFVLRRRFRQRVQEAIAAGVLLPDGRLAPGMGGGRRGQDFGAKPVLWEVWTEHTGAADDKLEKWEKMKPVSATMLRDVAPAVPAPPNEPPANATPSHQRSFNPATLVQGLFGLGRRNRASPSEPPNQTTIETFLGAGSSSAPSSSAAKPPDPETVLTESGDLVLSVLIAMPNPNRPTYVPSVLQGLSVPDQPPALGGEQETLSLKGKAKLPATAQPNLDDEDDILPELVFGITEMPWMKDARPPELPKSSSVARLRDGVDGWA